MIMTFLKNRKGGASISLIFAALIVVFLILPIFAAIIERGIVLNKGQIIQDAVDITNVAVYNSLNINSLSESSIDFNSAAAQSLYNSVLAKNLSLDSSLRPLPGSVAEAQVQVSSLSVYTSGLPLICPNGRALTRPAIHAVVVVPVRPSLYRQIILNAIGRQYVDLVIHVDSDIPVNK